MGSARESFSSTEQEGERIRPKINLDVSWLELFYDLVFVAVIHNIAHTLESGEVGWESILCFTLRVFSIWWLWHATTMAFNMRGGARGAIRSEIQNIPAVAVMCCVALMSSAAARKDDSAFLSCLLIALTIVLVWQLVWWRVLVRSTSTLAHDDIADQQAVDNAASWGILAKGMMIIHTLTSALLVPAAIFSASDSDQKLGLSFWGSWALFILLTRTFGGF